MNHNKAIERGPASAAEGEGSGQRKDREDKSVLAAFDFDSGENLSDEDGNGD